MAKKRLSGTTFTHTLKGRVVSVKTPKTATVFVERRKVHPFYGKSFIRSKRYLVHDDLGVSEGDVVEITQSRPHSGQKRFTILQVMGRDIKAIVTEQLKEEAAEAVAKVMPAEESRVESPDKVEEKETEEPIKPKAKSRKKGGKSSP